MSEYRIERVTYGEEWSKESNTWMSLLIVKSLIEVLELRPHFAGDLIQHVDSLLDDREEGGFKDESDGGISTSQFPFSTP